MLPDLRIAAEAAELLAERHENDGLAQMAFFDPHQTGLVGSTKSEAWLFGANRSGKTEALASIIASMARFGVLDPRRAHEVDLAKFRPVRVWAISLTFELSRNVLQAKLFDNGFRIDPRPPLIPASEIASWNVTTQTLRLKNGSIIIFKSTDGGRDVFQAADVDLAAFDEVPPLEVYRETTLRIGAGRRLYIRGAATILPPAGVPGGVSWMFLEKAQPWLTLGLSNEERNDKSPNLDIFTAGMRANPTILPEEIEQVTAVLQPGSPEYLIRVEGLLLPSIGGALCYSNFNRGYHVNEALAPMDQTGRRRPVVIPQLPLCLCVDFNPELGCWLVGQKVGKVFRVLDEIQLERSGIAEMSYEFRSRFPAHQAELWIYGDATGRRKEGQTGMSSFHLLSNYLSGYPVPIRFNLPDINPPQRDRVDAVNLQLRPPTGERLVEISPLCAELIKDMEGTKWNARQQIDKRHGRRSDGADCLGYWIAFDAPARTAMFTPRSLKSVRTPSYMKTGAFPHSRSNGRLYARR